MCGCLLKIAHPRADPREQPAFPEGAQSWRMMFTREARNRGTSAPRFLRSRVPYRLPVSMGCGDCSISIGTFFGSTPS